MRLRPIEIGIDGPRMMQILGFSQDTQRRISGNPYYLHHPRPIAVWFPSVGFLREYAVLKNRLTSGSKQASVAGKR